jgi:formylglycine-generating enzyme required for sulfatase activity
MQAQKFYGMAKVDGNLWVDETEVTVNEYRQFLNDLPEKDKKQYQPDVTVFKNIDPTVMNLYFTHPVYDNFPIVGINYEQALAFCKWRTDIYNKDPNNRLKVTFTLPTAEEWDKIASATNPLPGIDYIDNITDPAIPEFSKEMKHFKKHGYLVNCSDCEVTDCRPVLYKIQNKKKYSAFLTDATKCYGSGKIKGLAGNAAEMTLDKKIVGGSWKHGKEFCKNKSRISEEIAPTTWLGFRCVVRVE